MRRCADYPRLTWEKGATIAIYSLNMSPIGRSTHAARTAGAHIRYITRPQARPVLMGARMPVDAKAARRWLDAQEKADRKNARVIDKLTMALPVELNRRQRRALVRVFGDKVTEIVVEKPEAGYALRAGNHVPFLIDSTSARRSSSTRAHSPGDPWNTSGYGSVSMRWPPAWMAPTFPVPSIS